MRFALVVLSAVIVTGCSCGEKTTSARAILTADASHLDFGQTNPNVAVTRTLTLTNEGSAAITVHGVATEADELGAFTVQSAPERLEPGTQGAITVAYTPTVIGTNTAWLVINSDSTNAPELHVSLFGSATECVPRGCAANECGALSNGCGAMIDCGGCAGAGVCVDNLCSCTAETDAAMCTRLQKDCANVTAVDNCGASRTVNCGSCTANETCTANVCSCVPETDTAFCSRLAKNCGSVTAADNCGVSRTVDCGSCGAFTVCGGGGVQNVCGSTCTGGKLLVNGECISCDVVVPSGTPSIVQAIAAAPSPGNVCVAGGNYTEEVTLRPHVSLYGEGSTKTTLNGHISIVNLPDADATRTVISGFKIASTYLAAIGSCPVTNQSCSNSIYNVGKTIALELRKLSFQNDPGPGTVYCANLQPFGGSVDVQITNTACVGDRGFFMNYNYFTNVSEQVSLRLVAENNHFEPASGRNGLYQGVEFTAHIDANGGSSLPAAGSLISVVVRNNVYDRYTYEGVYLNSSLPLPSTTNSSFLVANNTMVGSASSDKGVWINGSNIPTIVANNLFWLNDGTPVHGSGITTNVANLTPGTDPFVNLSTGDFHLKAGSAPIDAANATYAPATDTEGNARVGAPDIGAYEWH